MESSEAKFIKMTTEPVSKLILTLAVPTIISMMVTSIYNMADTFFVGKLGTSASGAVGVIFSLMAIIQAIGFMLGMGSGIFISRLMGQKDTEYVNRVGSTSFFTALAMGILITIFGLLFIDKLIYALGATKTIFPFAKDYAKYILFGAPFMCTSFVMNNHLRSEGNAFLAMLGIATGGVLNIILDPIFIFVFKLGISGAAIATILSQIISFLILFSHFITKRSSIIISTKYLTLKWNIFKEILSIGMPSFFRQTLASIATITLNFCAAPYGDAAIAAMSIVSRVSMFILSVLLGFGQGFQPVAGFNYGAKKYNRLCEAFFFCVKVGVIVFAVLGFLGFVFSPQIVSTFRKEDAEVIKIGAFAMRAQFLFLPIQSIVVMSNMLFQSAGKTKIATFISTARQGLFFLPLIFILSNLLGLLGVQITQPISDVATCIVCIPFTIKFISELKSYKAE